MDDTTIGWLVIGPVLALMGYGAWRLMRGAFSRRAPAKMMCARCGTLARPRIVTPGSLAIEVLLWCVLIVPGVLYGLWRASRRKHVCAACGSGELLPADSPMAARLLGQLNRRG